MAYKRKTTKTGTGSRRSITLNTNGPTTFSNSTKAGNVTYTHTSKGGKYYTTQTIRRADGFVERKRIYSSAPKKAASKPFWGSKSKTTKKSAKSNDESFWTVLVVFGALLFLALIFGG